jgi:hypothetical protein
MRSCSDAFGSVSTAAAKDRQLDGQRPEGRELLEDRHPIRPCLQQDDGGGLVAGRLFGQVIGRRQAHHERQQARRHQETLSAAANAADDTDDNLPDFHESSMS